VQAGAAGINPGAALNLHSAGKLSPPHGGKGGLIL